MEAESRGQDISEDDHGLTEACYVLGSWNTREAKTLKPCLRAPRHGAVVSALTAWRKGKALSVSASWFSKHSCAWTAGGAERERAGASGPGDGRWGHHRSGHGHSDQVWTENSLPVLNAHVVFTARAGREAGNLCLPEAVKIRQQDDESKEAGWLHTLQEERNGQPTSSHPT